MLSYGAAAVGLFRGTATPGLAMAGAGNVLSTIGSVLEIATNYASGDTEKGKEGVKETVIYKAFDLVADFFLPGPTPSMTGAGKALVGEAKETTKTAAESARILGEKELTKK